MNYSELLQLAKSWGNFISDRIIIWRLPYIKKLQEDKNGVFLISLNEKYSPIPVGENDRFDILGKVVGKNHPNELRDFQQ